MALGVVIQVTVPKETLERWEAEREQRREKRAAEKAAESGSSSKHPPGFTMGFMTGAMSAREGARKPSAAELDAIARRAATQNKTPDNKRGVWIDNFKTAFWMGWRRGR